MPRRQKQPLRALTHAELVELERLSRAQQTAAAVVSRARTVLAVAHGRPYTVAARDGVPPGNWTVLNRDPDSPPA